MQTSHPKGYESALCLLTLMFSLSNMGFAGAILGKGPGNANFVQAYSAALQSSFGTPPYTYQLISGALPPGLSMDRNGNITGTATLVGKFSFQVQVTDSSQPPKHQVYPYTLVVVVGTDLYGGMTAPPSPGGTSGFFRQEKVAGRWNLVSPVG
jgi:Putative Ig domain